jgi:hypothetical protein
MSPEFWSFQLKDAVTGVIALAGLTIALTNLYNAYLRRPRIVATPGRWISFASHRGDDTQLRIFMNSLFYNRGSEPALIVSLTLKLIPIGTPASRAAVAFAWDEFVSRQEVRDSGALHHKGIRAVFEGKAFALVVPKTDAIGGAANVARRRSASRIEYPNRCDWRCSHGSRAVYKASSKQFRWTLSRGNICSTDAVQKLPAGT